jgi:pimeloyl-ACP methyl ester carboxylesterase
MSSSSWKDCPQISSDWSSYSYAYKGQSLNGWIKRNNNAKFRVLVFHGNAGKACDRTYWEDLLGIKNAEIILVEYPGYDGTTLTYERLLESALDTYDYFSNGSVKKIVLVGESLGTAPATYVASKRKPNAIILNSMFTSIADLAKYKFPFLPIDLILQYPFPSNLWAKEVDAPVLSVHGDSDLVIPFDFGEKQALNFSKCELIKIRNAGHNDWTWYLEDKHRKKIVEFLSLNLDL